MSSVILGPGAGLAGVEGKGDGGTLYHRFAASLHASIERGTFLAGDRIPSVRQASKQFRLSIATVLRAYLLLESQGVIESRPQSGYFVRQPSPAPVRAGRREPSAPDNADVAGLMLSTLRAIHSDGALPLGSPYPDPALLPCRRIELYASAQARRHSKGSLLDDLPPGNPAFIRQLARRYAEHGHTTDPGEFIVTLGATEALRLCLQAVAQPGAAIAVESPCYYGMLETITQLGMRAVEISCDASGSIDLARLSETMSTQKITACMLCADFPNPLGKAMTDEKKRELLELAGTHDIPIIENAEYSELHFGPARPLPLKAFDSRGLVLHCSSFSRCLTHQHRIGWALPGRYRQRVESLKFLSTVTTPANVQLALAEYLQDGGYDHHLRKMRKTLAQNANIMRSAVQRFFPDGTRSHVPDGGYVLWVELFEGGDSLAMYREALGRGITIAPGRLFSTQGSFPRHFRLNFSSTWTPRVEAAVKTLGEIATSLSKLDDR